MQNDKTRLYYLDAIRGIAALMVVFSHYAERTPVHSFRVFEFFRPGQFGVVVFFMLSGFVIPYSFKHGGGDVRGFLISRFFRLYPAYWFSVMLAAVSATLFLQTPISLKMIMANLTMIQKLLGYPDAFGIYWTLLVELIFYALCVLMALMGFIYNLKVRMTLSIFLLFIGLATSFARFKYGVSTPVGAIVSLSMMLFGSIWREFVVNGNNVAMKCSFLWVVLFIVVFPFISIFAYNFDRGLGENAVNYSISFISGVVAFMLLTTVFKIYGKIFIYLGAISYSIYLLHPFVLEFTNSKLNLNSDFYLVAFIAYVLATILLASISYHFIEKPSVVLGRRLKHVFLLQVK